MKPFRIMGLAVVVLLLAVNPVIQAKGDFL